MLKYVGYIGTRTGARTRLIGAGTLLGEGEEEASAKSWSKTKPPRRGQYTYIYVPVVHVQEEGGRHLVELTTGQQLLQLLDKVVLVGGTKAAKLVQ